MQKLKRRLEHPNEYRTQKKRQDYKRRGLGNNCLNERFEGSHGHHVNINDVVFIPKQLHESVLHNVWTAEGMIEINDKVRLWLADNTIGVSPIQFEYIPITDLPLIISKQRGRPRKELTDPKAKRKQLYMVECYQRTKCKTIYPLSIYNTNRTIQPILKAETSICPF